MPKPYYILVSRGDDSGNIWAIEFGDYDRSVVKDELTDLKDGHHQIASKDLRILRVSDDTQTAIDEAVRQLNNETYASEG